jgi:methionyl-tRNA formyltransferase
MRIIFMGTPHFAVPTLDALLGSSHDIVAVYTAPPRPAHRGKKMSISPVHELAQQHHVPVFTPASLKSLAAQTEFAAFNADIAVVVAYGLLLPQPILDAPRLGCINIHPSDLPRWRGAAPIARSLMAGDTHTAICIMQMDAGLDTGAVWMREPLDVPMNITAPAWEATLAEKSASVLLQTLDVIAEGKLRPVPQTENGLCYAHKLEKHEYALQCDRPAQCVLHHLHGISPYGYVTFHGERIRIVAAEIIQGLRGAAYGTVIDDAFSIQCGDDYAIRPLIMQREGKKTMPAAECLRGMQTVEGYRV